jgi:hypothetical protein
LQEYVFPIGKNSPAIEIPEVKIKWAQKRKKQDNRSLNQI